MRERITNEFNKKIDDLEISEKERSRFLKTYSKSSLIEFIVYAIILILMIINAKKIISLSYMSLSSLMANEATSGIILFCLGGAVVLFLLTNVILFSLGYFHKINIKDRTYVKYHLRTENIQFFLKGVFVVYLILTVVLSNARVEGPSMEDSFHTNDRVVLWHVLYTPKDDDVIVAKITLEEYPKAYVDAGETESYYIKRVVGVAGDSVKYTFGNDGFADLLINDVHVEYLSQYQVFMLFNKATKADYEGVVPKGKLIIMGDNRNNSTDSRKFGMLNTKDVMGKVVFRIYPFDQLGSINKQIKE